MVDTLMCQYCKGNGKMRIIVCRTMNRGDGIPGYGGIREADCSRCKGVGSISQEQWQCNEWAKELKNWRIRIDPYFDQQECAAAMGIDMWDYRHLEQGEVVAWQKYARLMIDLKQRAKPLS